MQNYIISQILATLSGLFGGLSISFFWQPKKLYQYGKFTAGMIIGSISVSTTFALIGLTTRWLKMDFYDADIALGLGYVIGAMSVALIAWLANFFSNRENKDILEIAHELHPLTHNKSPTTQSTKKSYKK